MNDNPYRNNSEEEEEVMKEFALCDNTEEESSMIWNVLDEAQETALRLNQSISDIIIMCEQAKHFNNPYQQLQDMHLEEEPKESDFSMLSELGEMIAYALRDVELLWQKED
jgi:hypothetical protein